MGRRNQRLKFVWPKDGPKGKQHRGFWGRLDNILTGKGPDIFLDRAKSNKSIKPDHWGNWDTYHVQRAQLHEMGRPAIFPQRLDMRYDPHSRRYKRWVLANDHDHTDLENRNGFRYPRFTYEEGRKIARQIYKTGQVDPLKMGKEWNYQGPKRFDGRHNWFWQDAHRIGENIRQKQPMYGPVNSNFFMHQNRPEDLEDWIKNEFIKRIR